MKTVREVMIQDIVTIHPASTIKTAVILMKGHEIGALPVVNGEALLGLLECQDVLARNPDEHAGDAMNREFVSVEPDLPLNKIADVMAKAKATRVLVEEDGRLVGILTHSDLMPELGRSYDPLTGLPWSDTLREWAEDALRRGDEISIVFFDVDSFGLFNKNHGHIVGDTVLKSISAVLKGLEDPNTDLLCRMGGDEFVMCSIRPREEVLYLAMSAQERVISIHIQDLDDPIGLTYGVAGGRRTKEREATHYAATIDDLLNRASQECNAAKREKRGAVGTSPAVPESSPAARLRIQQITYSFIDDHTQIDVNLSMGGVSYHHNLTGYSSVRSAARIAADACAGAVQQALPAGYRLVVEDVAEFRLPDGTPILLTTSVLASNRQTASYYGVAVIRRGDTYRAAVASVLSAINRPLGHLLKSAGKTPPGA